MGINRLWLIIGLMTLVLSSYTLAVIDQATLNQYSANTVVYYKLEEDAAPFVDSAVHKNLTTGNPDKAIGILNYAQNFSTDEIYTTAVPTQYDKTKSFTFGAWIRPDTTATAGWIFGDRKYIDAGNNNDNNFWAMYANGAANTVVVYACNGGSYTISGIPYTAWTHIMVVKNDTDSKLYVYVNGKYNGTDALTGDCTSTADLIYMGNRQGSDNWYDGSVDEAFLLNSTANTDFADFLYNSGAPGANQQLPYTYPTSSLSVSVIYPINQTTYYGNYNGSIIVQLDNVNVSATCSINDTRWTLNTTSPFGNQTVHWRNNTAITTATNYFLISCNDSGRTFNLTGFYFLIKNAMNLLIYNEENITQLIDEPFTLEIISTTSNTSIYYITDGNTTLSDLTPDDYEIRYYSDNHLIRSRFATLNNNQNITVNLYALNTTYDDPVDVVVRDFTLVGLNNATIRVQRWYTSINGGLTIAEGVSNSVGKFRFYLNKGDVYYKIVVEYGGEVVYSTNWEILNDDTFRITTDTLNLYNSWGDVSGVLTLENSSLPYYFQFEYSNKASDVDNVCLATYAETKGVLSLVATDCSAATSATITRTINENKTNVGRVYLVYTNSPSVTRLIDEEIYIFFSNFEEAFRENGLLISIILVLVITFGTMAISKGNPIAIIAAFDVAILFIKFTKLFSISYYELGIIIPGSFVVMYYLNKR